MNPKSITVPALPEALPTVLDFITQILDACACPPAARTAIEIAAEEIFINIARYAYAAIPSAPASGSAVPPPAPESGSAVPPSGSAVPPSGSAVPPSGSAVPPPASAAAASSRFPGQATVTCGLTQNPPSVTIRFTDAGAPYNPLAKPDPDLTLDAKARPIGGLGIYMVKNSMDGLRYEYRGGQNILTITKRLT